MFGQEGANKPSSKGQANCLRQAWLAGQLGGLTTVGPGSAHLRANGLGQAPYGSIWAHMVPNRPGLGP